MRTPSPEAARIGPDTPPAAWERLQSPDRTRRGGMSSAERPLTVHLARRAGFGATPDELDTYEAMGYDAVVEHLLNPTESRHTPDDLVFRRHVDPPCRARSHRPPLGLQDGHDEVPFGGEDCPFLARRVCDGRGEAQQHRIARKTRSTCSEGMGWDAWMVSLQSCRRTPP